MYTPTSPLVYRSVISQLAIARATKEGQSPAGRQTDTTTTKAVSPPENRKPSLHLASRKMTELDPTTYNLVLNTIYRCVTIPTQHLHGVQTLHGPSQDSSHRDRQGITTYTNCFRPMLNPREPLPCTQSASPGFRRGRRKTSVVSAPFQNASTDQASPKPPTTSCCSYLHQSRCARHTIFLSSAWGTNVTSFERGGAGRPRGGGGRGSSPCLHAIDPTYCIRLPASHSA